MSNNKRPLATVPRLHWRCSACGSTVIVEVTDKAVVRTRIEGLDEKGELVFGPHTDVEVGTPQKYECAACGHQVKDEQVPILSRRDLTTLLKRNLSE